MEYTKGPWHCDKPDQFGDINICHRGNELAIAAVVSNLRPSSKTEANARLIASAPELLEALKAAEQHLDYCGYGDKWERECAITGGLDKQIEFALAKATGESK